jgi:hypothetical protein
MKPNIIRYASDILQMALAVSTAPCSRLAPLASRMQADVRTLFKQVSCQLHEGTDIISKPSVARDVAIGQRMSSTLLSNATLEWFADSLSASGYVRIRCKAPAADDLDSEPIASKVSLARLRENSGTDLSCLQQLCAHAWHS